MRLDTLAGETDVDPLAAVTFLMKWFQPGDLVTVVGTREKKANQPHLIANVYKAEELIVGIRDEPGFLNSLVNGDDGSQWNLYVQVCPALKDLPSPFKRGGDENVRAFRGVWVDLDVKPGSFPNQDAALNFLRGLAVFPSIVVTTGSGGAHAYWPLDADLSPADGREFARGWWSYLAEEAEKVGAKVDKLVDIARMMRLPGTVRWPKVGEKAVAAPVKLFYSGGPANSADAMRLVSAAASTRRYDQLLRTQQMDKQRHLDADSIARMQLPGGMGRWSLLKAIARVEDMFNQAVTWPEILEPVGWNWLREDPNGRHEWGRPGRFEKSATTDYPESPDVMSLLSSSEDSGLFDLKDAGIALTKYRVALRFNFGDNETDIVEWTMQRLADPEVRLP